MSGPTRKYAMTRISAGDYILPSNDGKTLWRIYQYDEDGSAEVSGDGKRWRPLIGKFWGTAKYERPFHNAGERIDHDFLDWSNWLVWETELLTRKAAIEAALREVTA